MNNLLFTCLPLKLKITWLPILHLFLKDFDASLGNPRVWATSFSQPFFEEKQAADLHLSIFVLQKLQQTWVTPIFVSQILGCF